jgi:YD repeat-containing protein
MSEFLIHWALLMFYSSMMRLFFEVWKGLCMVYFRKGLNIFLGMCISHFSFANVAPIIFYSSQSLPNHQAVDPGEIVSIANSESGRNMATYNACVSRISSLPIGESGYCSVIPLSSPEQLGAATYNNLPNSLLARGTQYQFFKNPDGTTYSTVNQNVNSASIGLSMSCPDGASVSCVGQNNNYTCSCAMPDLVPDNCASAGNPINYLTGDKFEQVSDYVDSQGLSVKRKYLNQRQGWAVDKPSRLYDLTGRFSGNPLISSNNYCSGYSTVYKLKRLNLITPIHNDYEYVPFLYCLNYLRLPNQSARLILITSDGFHKTFYQQNGGYYNSDFYSAIAYEIDPALNDGNAWLVRYPNSKEEFFDQNGMLKKSQMGESTITYAYQNNRLVSKTNRAGASIIYEYDALDRIVKSTLPGGEYITYDYSAINNSNAYVLHKVVYPDTSQIIYLYENSQYPYALTGIIDNKGIRYATWAYDEKGRAISSEHANSKNKWLFDYSALDSGVNRVSIINPLMKKTIYSFSFINNKRLITRVDGEATSNCGAASKLNEYYPSGKLKSKIDWKGIKTTYQYNSLGQEISRTEAFGTPEARTITTEWHPTLYLKSKIIEPDKETTFTYDVNGRLLNQSVRSLIN